MKPNRHSFEEVGAVIYSMLVADKRSLKCGVPLVELDRDYKEMEGSSIPYRELGFPCLLDFLESLERSGKIVLQKRNGMTVVYVQVNENVAHISRLVIGQNDSRRRHTRGGKRSTARSFPRAVPYHPPVLESKMLADVIKFIQRKPNGVPISKILEYVQDRLTYKFEEEHLLHQLRKVTHEIIVERDFIYPVRRHEHQPPKSSPPKDTPSKTTHEHPAGMSDGEDDCQLVPVAASRSTIAQKPAPTNSKETKRFDEEPRVTLVPNDKNANSPRKDDNCNIADEDEIRLLVSPKVQFRLEKLIQKHPDGIWCADLPRIYQREYTIPLSYEELGFDSVNDFAAYLPKIFHCVRNGDTGDFKLFNAKESKPDMTNPERSSRLTLAALHSQYEKYYIEKEEAVPESLSLPVSQKLTPDCVMERGETVPQILVSGLFPDADTYVQVVVVDVLTPSFFWIHMYKNIERFRGFMAELHEFYTLHASEYVMPIILMERGLNCAALYEKKWHRGIIKTVKPNDTVSVMFYDYGTVSSYPAESIHFLHRSFSALPAQAIPCGLYKVKPRDTPRWPHAICQEFVNKVLEVPLFAMKGSIDEENNSMLIALVNTEGDDDLYINDWMIDRGYAVVGTMGDKVDMNEKREDQPVIINWPPGHRGPISSSLNTIQEEPDDLRLTVNQLVKKIADLESQLEAVKATRAVENPAPKSVTANVDCSLFGVEMVDQNAELRAIPSELKPSSIGNEPRQQGVTPEPPPIPPRPQKLNIGGKMGSSGFTYEPKEPYVNGFDEKHDLNMNFVTNPFNAPEKSSATVFTPQFSDSSFELPVTKVHSQPTDSASAFDFTKFPTHYQNGITSVTSNSTTDSVAEAPKKSPTSRESLEKSFANSAKNFLERLEATSKARNQATNPFAADLKKDPFTGKNWSTAVPVSKNPFASEAETSRHEQIQQEKNQQNTLASTRVIYESGPVLYDFPKKNKIPSKCNNTAQCVNGEEKAFETSKQMNVASWVKQGCDLKADHVNKPLDTANSRPRNGQALHPATNTATLSHGTHSETCGISESSQATWNPDSKATQFKWIRAIENAQFFFNKEETRDDAATGWSSGLKMEGKAVGKQNTVLQEKPKSTEVAVEQDAGAAAAVKDWNFREIHLSRTSVHLINVANEGWLTTDEFCLAFANVITSKYALLEIFQRQKVKIPFRFIERSEYPDLFRELDSTSLAVPRTYNYRIVDTLHLTPIKMILRMLRKLKIITLKEVDEAMNQRIFPTRSTALFDAYTIITLYAKL